MGVSQMTQMSVPMEQSLKDELRKVAVKNERKPAQEARLAIKAHVDREKIQEGKDAA